MQSFSDAAVAHMDEIAVQVARARGDALEFVVGLQGSDGVPGTWSTSATSCGT